MTKVTNVTARLSYNAMHKRGLCRRPVVGCWLSVCLSICPSVCHVLYSIETSRHIIKLIHFSSSAIPIFLYAKFWRNSDRFPVNGVSNAGGYKTSSAVAERPYTTLRVAENLAVAQDHSSCILKIET